MLKQVQGIAPVLSAGCNCQKTSQVLFAICHDAAPLKELEELAGKALEVSTTAAGGVSWDEVSDSKLGEGGDRKQQPRRRLNVTVPRWCRKWVVGMDGYSDGVVGAKSKNLAGARLSLFAHPAKQLERSPGFLNQVTRGILWLLTERVTVLGRQAR